MCGSPRAVLALRSRARLHVRLHVVGRGASVPTAHFHRTSCARLRAVRRAQMVQSSVQQTRCGVLGLQMRGKVHAVLHARVPS